MTESMNSAMDKAATAVLFAQVREAHLQNLWAQYQAALESYRRARR